ncbi:zinc dependent phospholipase C family protein [Plantactinospora siamensis]|uniref:Zinc dependent phospholipase C family protein n=1 Tax=Plantactinospora siamensis TaxID=555372 RepID=A0ABV6P4N0_9ACTN
MPGHFTHIYTARRVADLLASGTFTDWPDLGGGGDAVAGLDPVFCGQVMRKWEKFTAIGAIGPDLFFFSQDWSNDLLGPRSDDIMLALAVFYFFDAAKEDDWEPLLVILEDVDTTLTAIIRFLIKLQKIWDDFKAVWDATVGPLVDAASELLDDLTGGVLNEFKTGLEQLLDAIEAIGVQELTTFADVWGAMNTVVAKGFPEDSFLWSDMTHYRRTSALCQALVAQAQAQLDDSDAGQERYEQFLAYALGYITHIGTDTIAHSFVNEQCGGPYRDHPTRHHLIENHIDAWNYAQSGAGGTIPTDPWGKTDDYPEVSSSALWFAVQLTPQDPHGKQRPSPLSDDPAVRKEQLDVDGEMPMWMAESIVRALKETFADHPHPQIYSGDAYQQQIDQGKLTAVVRAVTGHGLDRPFQELLDAIAPPPPFAVPKGFPLPWEVATAYRLMITLYKLNFNGGWELPKPRVPDVVIVPPMSDFTNLFQPPDFSGVNGDNPVEDVCDVFIALVQWVTKEIAAVIKLIGDLIKAGLSPITYPVRVGLYEIAMKVWDIATKTHDVMAHTGILMPHAEQRYPDNGELKWPNEIDLPLITLGGTIDGAFKQALADAIDPFGNLDQDQSVVVAHSVRDPNQPYYPVLRYHADGRPPEDWEFHRPWAYPQFSEFEQGGANTLVPTPTETYDPSKSDPTGPPGAYKPMRPGPYPEGTTPDQVFFRTDAGFDEQGRLGYESAQSPWQTDQLNEALIGHAERRVSPLGDPVPFSAYLIGRLANPTDYATQFNLDADRGYAYLTWDWIRGGQTGQTDLGQSYRLPVAAPWRDTARWKQGAEPMQLTYVDPPPPPVIIELGPGAGSAAGDPASGAGAAADVPVRDPAGHDGTAEDDRAGGAS